MNFGGSFKLQQCVNKAVISTTQVPLVHHLSYGLSCSRHPARWGVGIGLGEVGTLGVHVIKIHLIYCIVYETLKKYIKYFLKDQLEIRVEIIPRIQSFYSQESKCSTSLS